MICQNCQAQNQPGTNYCRRCGIALTGRRRSKWIPVVVWFLSLGVLLWGTFFHAVSVINDRPSKPPIDEEKKIPPERDKKEEKRIEERNDQGEPIGFIIKPLSKSHVWVESSETEIEGIGDISKPDGGKRLSSELQDELRNAKELIVVGTADIRPGRDGLSENQRAGGRTRTLEQASGKIRGSESNVIAWNLGKWVGHPSFNIEFEDQRRVIFIELIRPNPRAEFESALRRALIKHENEYPIFKQLRLGYSKSDVFDIR